MADKTQLIKKIIDLELEMFLSVPADGSYNCQEYPDSFKLHRRAQFSIWSDDTLESYRNDLIQAKENGINLMTVKYARMDNLIPRENFNPLIEEIVAIQYRWQIEIFKKYPNLMAGARPVSKSDDSAARTSFETYLSGELETYSDNTLSLLHRDMTDKVNENANGSEQVYDYLVKEMGYDSVQAAEAAHEKKS
jgi:hypothetical protein